MNKVTGKRKERFFHIGALVLAAVAVSCATLSDADKAKIALANITIDSGRAWELTERTKDAQTGMDGRTIRMTLALPPPRPEPEEMFSKIPLTRKLVDDINSDLPIRRLQYFNSTEIRLEYAASSKVNYWISPKDGHLRKSTRFSAMETIIIAENTPGELLDLDMKQGILYIGFETADGSVKLPFREKTEHNEDTSEHNYFLDARKDNESGKYIIQYGDKRYEVDYKICQLVIDYEDLQQVAPSRPHQPGGRKVGEDCK